MTPGEAVYRLITGGPGAGSEQGTLRARMAEVERRSGGPGKAAAAAGVSARTWQRWRDGTRNPSKVSAERLRGVQRRLRLSAGREQRLRTGRGDLVITGEAAVSSDVRQRTVRPLPYVERNGWLDPVVDAYLRGDDREMLDQFNQALSDYVPGLTFRDVSSVTYQ